jgi:hypothetical protein
MHRQMTTERVDQLRLISGHIGFQAFHGDSRFADWLFVTTLRDPVRRLLSLYSYVKGWSGHPWYERISSGGIEEYLNFLEEDAFNGDTQCRMITGEPAADAAFETLMSQFFLAASTENLGAMLERLSARLGTHLELGRVNESLTRIDPGRVPPRAMRRIHDLNVQDTLLYERVRRSGLVGSSSWRSA